MLDIENNLDNRICDIEDCKNIQTYRQYLEEGIECFDLYIDADIDNLINEELNELLDFIDNLWEK